MKKNWIGCIILSLAIIAGCSKNDSPTVTPQDNTYLNTSANSSWNYQENDSSLSTPVVTNYTITSTSRDTVINTKSYHIYTNSLGGFNLQNMSGHDYYQFDSLPAGLGTGVFERLYLKDNVTPGTNWSQSLSVTIPGVPIPIPVTITNTVAENGISRTVNGVVYNNVIHVSTSLSSALIPAASLTTNINSYYAPKYGLIENSTIVVLDISSLGLMQSINLHTKLMSADLK